jgi:hypothetical protein
MFFARPNTFSRIIIQFTGKDPSTKKTWGEYVGDLQKLADDGASLAVVPEKKTIRTLDQIRDLDRNPLMHPRDVLSPSDAMVLFNLATSAIMAMAGELVKSEGQGSLPLGVPDPSANESERKKDAAPADIQN